MRGETPGVFDRRGRPCSGSSKLVQYSPPPFSAGLPLSPLAFERLHAADPVDVERPVEALQSAQESVQARIAGADSRRRRSSSGTSQGE